MRWRLFKPTMAPMATTTERGKKLGRPHLGDRKPATTYLPRQKAEKIDEIAALTGISRTALLQQVVEDFLDRTDIEALRERHHFAKAS